MAVIFRTIVATLFLGWLGGPTRSPDGTGSITNIAAELTQAMHASEMHASCPGQSALIFALRMTFDQ
jgi:hypothetical protein